MAVYYTAVELGNKNHVTLCFKPSEEYVSSIEGLIGKEFTLTFTGYGEYYENDQLQNTGYFVTLPEELKPYFVGAFPHCTCGVFNGGSAMNTVKIKKLFDCNIAVKGVIKHFQEGQH